MKNFYALCTLCFLLITGSPLSAQTVEQQKEQKKQVVPADYDANANGIDDAKEKQQVNVNKGSKKRDQFIDANGDGICDTRENGLGFRRGKGMNSGQFGKRQQGRHK
ncbi:MAG: hypothetical protein WCW40_00375 [Bacteroidota bacterium]